MAKATISLQFPETARDAAVVLVEQMWESITRNHVVVSGPEYKSGLDGWLKNAARVLAEANVTVDHSDAIIAADKKLNGP